MGTLDNRNKKAAMMETDETILVFFFANNLKEPHKEPGYMADGLPC
jgi:hypothetical protein